MNQFTFSTTSTIISRPGALSELSSYLEKNNIKRPLIVTDQGIVGCGLLDKLYEYLASCAYHADIECFAEVVADPPQSIVLRAIDVAKQHRADAVIGFGGGSSMDTAKLVALLSHPQNKQSLEDIYGVDNAVGQKLPLVLIPTTAGTGSEATAVAIVTTGETTKAGVVSSLLYPDVAILDGSLTVGLPRHVTAATGIDAMVHAIEAYTSKIKKNVYSDMLAKQALVLLSNNIHQACHYPDDVDARQAMLVGACLAGQAFANAPVAAVHALAYPLGGHFHIPHGLSNALVLPHVMRFNAPHCYALYAELAHHIALDINIHSDAKQTCDNLITALSQLPVDLGLPTKLSQMGISEGQLQMLASDAMLQTRLLINNPREINEQEALLIYKNAF